MAQQARSSNRKHQIVFRLHLLEKKVIAIKAKKAGLSRSEYLRQAALQQSNNPTPLTLLSQTDLCHLLVHYKEELTLMKELIEQRKDFAIELHGLIEQLQLILNHLST
ncbi:MAG: hypothetical protein ROO73_02275 [Roseivirga sp.]